MSKFVSLKTTLTDHRYLIESLEAMGCEVLKTKKVRTLLQREFAVDLAVRTKFGVVGFIQNKTGEYELAGDDMVLKADPEFIRKLTQKYAYVRVIGEAKKAGFQLIKETVGEDRSVRLVLRKW